MYQSTRLLEAPFLSKGPLLFLVVPLLLFIDQWTKHEVRARFVLGESLVQIQGLFDLTYVQNRGAAFGLLAQAPASFREPFFLLIPLSALVVMSIVFYRLKKSDTTLALALSLVMGGALGNLWDRIQLGFVVDFLDFHWHQAYHFPAFNVADSAICIGVAILMLDSLRRAPSASEITASAPENSLN